MSDDGVELQERLKSVISGVPRDEEQKAADEGRVSDLQRGAIDVMKKMIEQREKQLAEEKAGKK